MYLIIRGHIRNSFNNNELYLFIQKLYEIDTSLEIYIHTWNIVQNDISWRNMNNGKIIINVDMINEYFSELSKLIKHIIIDDDSKILLNGNTSGYVSSGKMPLVGWKNYWYGQYSIINFIKNSKSQTDNSIVINMRFDLFSKPIFSNIQHKVTEMLNFVKKYFNLEIKTNKFIYDNEECNIDNIFLGTIHSQFELVSKFHFKLDDIIKKYGNIHNHEKYVFRVNNDMCKIFHSQK